MTIFFRALVLLLPLLAVAVNPFGPRVLMVACAGAPAPEIGVTSLPEGCCADPASACGAEPVTVATETCCDASTLSAIVSGDTVCELCCCIPVKEPLRFPPPEREAPRYKSPDAAPLPAFFVHVPAPKIAVRVALPRDVRLHPKPPFLPAAPWRGPPILSANAIARSSDEPVC